MMKKCTVDYKREGEERKSKSRVEADSTRKKTVEFWVDIFCGRRIDQILNRLNHNCEFLGIANLLQNTFIFSFPFFSISSKMDNLNYMNINTSTVVMRKDVVSVVLCIQTAQQSAATSGLLGPMHAVLYF